MNTKGPGPGAHFACRRLGKMGVFTVEIILTDVDYRQLPQRGHVHDFVERSLTERSISEETDYHLVCAAHFARHGGSGGDTCTAANDGVRAQVAGFLVGDMHRAAFAPAVAG